MQETKDAGSIPGSGRPPGEGHGNPLSYSCLENPMDRGTWWGTVHSVTKSRTWLKQLNTTTTTKKTVTVWHDGGWANTTVAIILQYTNVSNPCALYPCNTNTVQCQLYLKRTIFKVLMDSGVVRTKAQGWGGEKQTGKGPWGTDTEQG